MSTNRSTRPSGCSMSPTSTSGRCPVRRKWFIDHEHAVGGAVGALESSGVQKKWYEPFGSVGGGLDIGAVGAPTP